MSKKNDFVKIWEKILSKLSENTIIYTLSQNKANEITSIDEEGIYIKTEKGNGFVSKKLIRKAWDNLSKDGVLKRDEHIKSTYRSSFITTLFVYLDLAEIVQDKPLIIKIKS